MFTGLVQALAEVVAVAPVPDQPGVRLVVRDATIAASVKLGDSVCVNGCCLTVVDKSADTFDFDAGTETLSRTNLGQLKAGDRVNLEGSLSFGDQLGGHYVTGHVDCLGTVEQRDEEGPKENKWAKFWFRVPAAQIRQMASKGSVTVDGISLTLVDVEDDPSTNTGRFSVALIPHTLSVTTLGIRQVGDQVNIETDVLAKYVERQLAGRSS